MSQSRDSRMHALDGLRGLAALIVVIQHSLLTTPAFAATYVGTDPGGVVSALTYSPLHIVWAGGEAVNLFFVLSGFVVITPFLSGVRPRWRRWFPQRLVRLYLPIWAAVPFSVLLAAIVTRSPHTPSWWLAGHADTVHWDNVRQLAIAIDGANSLNSSMWTMQWELVFSLALPAFVAVAAVTRRGWLAALLAALVVCGWGAQHDHLAVRYLAIFAVGAALAAGRAQWTPWVSCLRGWRFCVVLAAALAAFTVQWLSESSARDPSLVACFVSISAFGGALLVCLFAAAPPAVRLGTWRPVRLLGTISFSLYLVHEPIAVSYGQISGGHASPVLVLALTLATAIPVGWVFHRLVERPAQTLARGLGGARPVGAGPEDRRTPPVEAQEPSLSGVRT